MTKFNRTRSRLLCKELERVFTPPTTVDGYVGAMSVLFEDLRIEINALAAAEIPTLDGAHHRNIYFLRRSIATLKEFAHAITDLDQKPEFQAVKARFDEKTNRQWNRACRFFDRYGRDMITPVRHCVGAHFRGPEAAAFAIRHELKGSLSGCIEAVVDESGQVEFVLHFAHHIAAGAMTKKVPGGGDLSAKVRQLFRVVRVGYERAVRAVEAVVQYYLWDKFAS